MFINKKKDIIIPHTFHAKFAWQIGAFWWNENFWLPSDLQKYDFILGVSDHDRWYDAFDTKDIMDLKNNKEEKDRARIEYLEKSLSRRNKNTIADHISLTHVKSLATNLPEYINKIETIIASESQKEIWYFDDIQTITNLLDNISFDCSLWEDVVDTYSVISNFDTKKCVDITYSITGNTVTVSPWPFGIDRFSLVLSGYSKDTYPEVLELETVVFDFQKPFLLK